MSPKELLEVAQKVAHWLDSAAECETVCSLRNDGSVELKSTDDAGDEIAWGTFAASGALLVDTGKIITWKDEEIALVTINGELVGANNYKSIAAILLGHDLF